jgi:hypothetical protein
MLAWIGLVCFAVALLLLIVGCCQPRRISLPHLAQKLLAIQLK